MKQRGFTLIEVLVATSLLSALMLGLFSALYSVGQAEQRMNDRLELADQQRQIGDLLSRMLRHVSAQNWRHPSVPDGTKVAGLLTDGSHIEWVGTLPVHHGTNGRHFMRLSLDRPAPEATGALVLRYRPWTGEPIDTADLFPGWDQASERMLVPDVSALSIQARSQQAPRNWPADQAWNPDWQDNWPHPEALPEEIRIQLTVQGRIWPPIFVGLQPAPGTRQGGDGFTVGGGTR